ncbi:hypothetical protein BDV38DRAFT_291578 [Aspergillus pseudotamarii]|uniref:Zn(2)-C6 fungal-type domain-containing protein n=1 Tax=Aspergillus pseudotamarii TaxID=132259 RepID=A0A5N6SZI9_ASPPS|nr:uncharacterized protein BDV38DRAFT_291578 [Aspergillus pseudotamarii]KAE8139189.1 hypothetical protein BDV38DRAFT_291578 [Aspergillus pseudotamarii]
MKVAKSCSQCRIAKRKCTPDPVRDARCLQCSTRQQSCSWSLTRNAKHRLLPVDSPSYPRVWVEMVEDGVRDELVDLYLELIHDKPHTLFHPSHLKSRVRNGSLAKGTLYSILALAARFSTGLATRERTKDFMQSAKDRVKMSIDDITLDNVHATILIGNLCGSEGDSSGEALYFGIAFRMAQILRLPEPSLDDDEIMRESRLRTWCSLYMIDRWSSAGLNIPRQIQDGDQFQLPMSELDFHNLAPGQAAGNGSRITRPGLWGYMIILVRIFGQIQHLHRQLADGTLDNSGIEASTRQLASEFEAFIQGLPSGLQLTMGNMKTHARLGVGQAFVALHLGYHHYATLLYFPYLGSQLTHILDQKLFATRCKHHAAAFSDLLRSSSETKGCEVVYFIVAHMTVTSSSVLLHTLLFGQEDELPDTRRRLYYNFQILLRLKAYWRGVGMMIERLFTFQKACMLSMDRIYTMDKWIVKFLLQHALPIEGNLGPPATSQLAQRDKFANDALSMLRPQGFQ